MTADRNVHDVFLSYAHIDNEPEDPTETGWVEQFGRHLELRLRKLTGRKDVSVWRDKKLGGADLFDKVIEEAVTGSRVMVSLISKSYLNSAYCEQEIDWFRDKAAKEPIGLEVGNKLRVFAVLLQNLAPDQWPKGVQGTSAFPLHTVKDTRLERERLGDALPPSSEMFDAAVQHLAEEINVILDRIQAGDDSTHASPSRVSAASAPAEPEVGGSDPSGTSDTSGTFTVFLSHAPDDMRSQSRRLISDLKGQGIKVLEQLPPPYEEAEHAAAAAEAISGADLSIHLLGKSAGEAVEDTEGDATNTYPIIQARLGLEHAQSQLILQPEGLDRDLIDEPEYRAFLEGLDIRERDPAKFEVVRTDKNRMLDIILEKKATLEDARKREVEALAGKTAFVDLNLRDLASAVDMVDYLTKKNVSSILSPTMDPKQGMELFEDNLKRSEFYILYFGEVTADWVRHRLQEAQKLVWQNNLKSRIAVYAAPPFKAPSDINFTPYDVIENSSGFNPASLDEVLFLS